jgi:hypothetical protein
MLEDLTPKAFANFSPGIAERVRQLLNPFRVGRRFLFNPRVLAALEPWAEISERFRRLMFPLTS